MNNESRTLFFVFQSVSRNNTVNTNTLPLVQTILIVGRYEYKLSTSDPQYEI
jgi:hypothetical protein